MNHDDAVALLLSGVPAIRAHYTAGSCIASTKIGLAVLAALGVEARPVVVQAAVGNRTWWDYITMRTPAAEILADPSAWSVGLGVPNPGKDWHMHLVIVTARALVDLTLDQATRPSRGIRLAPMAFGLSPEERRRLVTGQQLAFHDDTGGGVVIYQARVGNRDYTTSANWGRRDAAMRHRIAGQILRHEIARVGR